MTDCRLIIPQHHTVKMFQKIKPVVVKVCSKTKCTTFSQLRCILSKPPPIKFETLLSSKYLLFISWCIQAQQYS